MIQWKQAHRGVADVVHNVVALGNIARVQEGQRQDADQLDGEAQQLHPSEAKSCSTSLILQWCYCMMMKCNAHQRKAWQVDEPLSQDQGSKSCCAVADDCALVVRLLKLQRFTHSAVVRE